MVPSAPPATDLANIPSIALGLHAHRWDAWLATYPLFAVHDIQSPPPPNGQLGGIALAQGATGFAWHSRRLQIVVSQSASYGIQNFQYLLPLNLAPGQVAPPTQAIPTSNDRDFLFATSQSVASVNYRWSRHWSTYLSPSFLIGGGIDNKEHPELSPTQYIPFQVTPQINARLDYEWSRISRLETLGSGYTSQFDDRRCDYATGGSPTPLTSQRNSYGICKSEGQEVEWEEAFRRALSTTTVLGVGVGGSIARTRIDAYDFTGGRLPSPVPDRLRFFPIVSGRLTHRFSWYRPEVSRLELEARLGPVMDIRFGWIDPRLSLTLRDISHYKKTQFKLTVEAGQTIPPTEPLSTTFVQGDLEALYQLGRRVSVGGGARGVWQRQRYANGEEFPFVTMIFYGTIVYHEPVIFLAGGRPPRQLRELQPDL